jgi:hypothetical protein
VKIEGFTFFEITRLGDILELLPLFEYFSRRGQEQRFILQRVNILGKIL